MRQGSNAVYLIMGKSGAGKTTLSRVLEDTCRLVPLQSWTTRRPRAGETYGHTFTADFRAWRRDHPYDTVIAWTEFAGHTYWATDRQLEDAGTYVIDPSGVDYLKAHYKGGRSIRVIYIDVGPCQRFRRMAARGDSRWEAFRRLIHDAFVFRGAERMADLVVRNDNLDKCLRQVEEYVQRRAGSEAHLYGSLGRE